MAQTSNSHAGCVDGCTRVGNFAVVQAGNSACRKVTFWDGTEVPQNRSGQTPSQLGCTSQARALKVYVPPGAPGLPNCDGSEASDDQYLEVWSTGSTGNARINFGGKTSAHGAAQGDGNAGSIGFSNRRGGFWNWYFANPNGIIFDWAIYPGSFQNGNEWLVLYGGVDEHVRGAGVNLFSGEDGGVHTYRDNSGANGFLVYTRTSTVRFLHKGQDGLTSAFGFNWRLWPDGRIAQQCTPWIGAEGCSATTTPRFQLGCEEITDDPDWFEEFALDTAPSADWELSTDSGATWAACPASFTKPSTALQGEYRIRHSFNIPQGYGGFWRVRALQSEWGTNLSQASVGTGTMNLDGSSIGASNIGSIDPATDVNPDQHWHSDYQAVEAGDHIFEYLFAAHSVDALVRPRLIANYRGTVKTGRQIQVLDCLNDDGTIANTRYFTTDNVETTIDASSTLTMGLCN